MCFSPLPFSFFLSHLFPPSPLTCLSFLFGVLLPLEFLASTWQSRRGLAGWSEEGGTLAACKAESEDCSILMQKSYFKYFLAALEVSLTPVESAFTVILTACLSICKNFLNKYSILHFLITPRRLVFLSTTVRSPGGAAAWPLLPLRYAAWSWGRILRLNLNFFLEKEGGKIGTGPLEKTQSWILREKAETVQGEGTTASFFSTRCQA